MSDAGPMIFRRYAPIPLLELYLIPYSKKKEKRKEKKKKIKEAVMLGGGKETTVVRESRE